MPPDAAKLRAQLGLRRQEFVISSLIDVFGGSVSSPSIPPSLHGFAGKEENVNLENRERVGVLWSLLQPPQELILSKKRNSGQN